MNNLSLRYPSKRAFITGAGSGLGRELCLKLAKENWLLGITDIDSDSLNETKKMISSEGAKVLLYHFDVANPQEFKASAEKFLKETGGIDLLINNAGVGEGTLFEDYSLENWNWITGINQMGVINGCHFFIPVFKKQGYGHIINIASAAGFANLPKMSPYNVTKAAVISLSESLYYELEPYGVDVSVVVPAFFRSSILQHARGETSITSKAAQIVDSSAWNAERAAIRILNSTGKRKFWIVFPWEGVFLFYLKRISPWLFRFFVTRMLVK